MHTKFWCETEWNDWWLQIHIRT